MKIALSSKELITRYMKPISDEFFIFFIVVFGLGVFWIIWSSFFPVDRLKDVPPKICVRDTTEMSGRIGLVWRLNSMDYFTLVMQKPEFEYEVNTRDFELKESDKFARVAETGDSIVKKKNSDTMILFKANRKLQYIIK